MLNIWLLDEILCIALAAVLVLRFMHMFQLNSYSAAEHFRWLKRPGSILQTLRPRKAKKPLVFTPRVVRMLVVLAILTALLAVFCPLATPLLLLFSPILPALANLINAPVEAAIRQRYIRDAKRILAQRPDLLVIGITGSYGKTSVKNYLTKLLKAKYNVLMTPESYNTPMGVVMTIRQDLRSFHNVFICEMGAKKSGEIKEICDIVSPDIGIITAIAEQHLESFGSLSKILDTKLELAKAVRAKGKGPVFMNLNNELLREKSAEFQSITYGTRDEADFRAQNISANSSGTQFSLAHSGAEQSGLRTKLLGEHNVINLAGAIALADFLKVSWEDIRYQTRRIEAADHRLSSRKTGEVTIIDDSFNSNPDGSRAALETLRLFSERKILVTPGMVELGAKEDFYNTEFGKLAAEICDTIVLIGAKQTKAILAGIELSGGAGKVQIRETVLEGIALARGMYPGEEKAILLENDLPDNYAGGKA